MLSEGEGSTTQMPGQSRLQSVEVCPQAPELLARMMGALQEQGRLHVLPAIACYRSVHRWPKARKVSRGPSHR